MATDPMAEIRASFFVECEELLESLQDALSDMEEGNHDNETINIVFRAVHSIKGGAGAFGLDALVGFAHRYETVLDELRSGRMTITPEAMKLFFQAADFLQDHVRAARDAAPPPDGSEDCLVALEALIGGGAGPVVEEEVTDFQPMGLAFDFGTVEETPTTPVWTVRFRPAAALFSSGNEPLHLLRALGKLGSCTTRCDLTRLPTLESLDPEGSWLEWTVEIAGDVTDFDIREVFDFVEDVCEIEITQGTAETAPSDAGGLSLPDFGLPGLPDLPPLAQDPEDPVPLAPAPAPRAEIVPMPKTEPRAEVPPPPFAAADQPTAPAAGPAGGAAPREAASEPSATVRVDLDRIDRLVNLVGELVINQAMLAQSVAEAGLPPNSAVMTGLEAFMMLTRDIQDSVMMIRAQPVKPLFQRMARIVREASGAVGKEVRLRTEGEATEVDKTVIERLADPLTHMIRNAVDHGLERPDKRRAAGKTAEGVITLSAQHRSGRVVIEVADDGAGINRPKVREIAISKGLIPPDAQLSDSEIDNLLFLPGFSTADQVSALSGRGVGMDVVRQAIQSLGGRITIHSEPGKGTRFSISLPLTLAVLDGMVVNVAGETLVVPLSAILETATLTDEDIRALGPNTNVIHVRGAFVPLYDLGAELGYRAPKSSYAGGIVLLTAQENGTRSALVVDSILEQRQVVIKGLQRSYGHIPGVAAATILGDGQIALILDPPDLVQNASGRTRSPAFALAG
ncbi:two-component system chemotaxis sensor kinase CheA [Rhodobacter capsulatus]|uniref:Chemotaxis protein CheA n=2 Tax=Rhodobacter capsulatus TaxID=1061 RepID=A0A0Q0WMQ4_RHOCA|nr:chemotaxis protein CheA [Rhodobacter capsulatus]KQB17212.1 chemotaxis protein CheA [Rhodobacter capsulatus]KQB17612.1 chemotaxis protein CheA [Rhodobacter capsulatus]PZX27405.1 two-component system chemotaxis sensor kinase CheA [Rhodobacter capsulatus]WER07716.1 chemotaxis protein CheA [Rhodobacter capsulatus]SDE97851.1 two-component system, chemotaxis family, sensor kinase CheA [Rhodobacter capsulatus]